MFATLRSMKHGFLLINKPVGPTSHDIVAQVRKALSERKVGHLGTLDPAASGLLVLAIGNKALKVVELFSDLPKEYRAEITFGSVSSTYDGEGVIEETPPKPGWIEPTDVELQNVIRDHFLGNVKQVPPIHSAVSIGGERAYRKARRGQSIDMPERTIQITECDVVKYAFPKLVVDVACSSGTYIRSLAHDLGQRLRCGGYMSGLHRTRVGEWSEEFAVTPEEAGWSYVEPLKEVLFPMGGIDLTAKEADDIRFGRTIKRQVKPDTLAWEGDLPIAILVPAKDGSQGARPRKVF